MNRMKTVLGVSIAALIAFGGVLSVADVGQAGERDRKGDREWRDEGDWKGEWKRDRDDDDDRDDDWRGRRGYGRGYWGGYGRGYWGGYGRPYGYYRGPGYYGGGCGWLYRNALLGADTGGPDFMSAGATEKVRLSGEFTTKSSRLVLLSGRWALRTKRRPVCVTFFQPQRCSPPS